MKIHELLKYAKGNLDTEIVIEFLDQEATAYFGLDRTHDGKIIIHQQESND